MLEVQDLACGYNNTPILKHVSFSVSPGKVLVLLGPNGVGKTTLFKTILGLLPRLAGEVSLDGHEINMRPGSKDMRQIAYVPQAHTPAFAFTVMEIVLMGRTAQMSAFGTPGEQDRNIARNTLENMGLGHLCDRLYTEISGGERQMVLIARALVQQPRVLIMDEPAASLDLGNQAKLLRIIKNLAQENDLCVIMTSHNPDHALLVADDVLMLTKTGTQYGTADQILTEARLSEVYETDICILNGASSSLSAGDNNLRACTIRI